MEARGRYTLSCQRDTRTSHHPSDFAIACSTRTSTKREPVQEAEMSEVNQTFRAQLQNFDDISGIGTAVYEYSRVRRVYRQRRFLLAVPAPFVSTSLTKRGAPCSVSTPSPSQQHPPTHSLKTIHQTRMHASVRLICSMHASSNYLRQRTFQTCSMFSRSSCLSSCCILTLLIH